MSRRRGKLPAPPTEHEECVKFIQWCDTVGVLKYPEHVLPNGKFAIFAILNGGDRDIRVATRLKAEGGRAGVPDYLLPGIVPKPDLYIEMKRQRGGRISPAQAEWHEYLRRMGHIVEVPCGADEAITALEEYMFKHATKGI